MKSYKSIKGWGTHYLLSLTVFFDLVIFILLNYSNSFLISSLLYFTFIVFTVYQIYYIIIFSTVEYKIDEDSISINSIFGLRKIKILFNEIKSYQVGQGNIKGVKLSGYGNNHFDIGKSVIDNIGTTTTFLTSSKYIIYFRTDNINLAISPINHEEIESIFELKKIKNEKWVSENKKLHIYKDKNFLIPFFIASLIVLFLMFNPFVLYLTGKLPATMPLNFDPYFHPLTYGTGKQFALNQTAYGLLNMALLFCMYYVSYFYSKYDEKSSYKYIYLSLFVSLIFLFIQIRIVFFV